MAEDLGSVKHGIYLSVEELYLLDKAVANILAHLREERMIFLRENMQASYEGAVQQAVNYEMLLNKIRGKEL